MRPSRTIASLATLAAGAALVATQTGPATAVVEDDVTEVTSDLAGPLQFAVNGNGRAFVAQSFGPGTITKVTPSGQKSDVVTDLAGSITGVGLRRGAIAYTFVGGSAPDTVEEGDVTAQRGGVESSDILLKLQDRRGNQRVLGDLGQAEESMNPDGFQAYGWLGYRQSCGEDPPEGHEPRGGIVENNPYAVAAAPGGGWYVADAAANVIWKVKRGNVTPVTVLKPRVIHVTEELATEYELDPCTIGTRYNLEAVPTDIEVAPSGRLFVSLLPGEGNADGTPAMEGLGSVVKVNPATGNVNEVATGFTGATNIALAGKRIFVNELYIGQISVFNRSTRQTRAIASTVDPVAIDLRDGKLWVTYDAFGNGRLGIVNR